MAKANVSKTIRQHLEKAVMCVCALLLLYGIFYWGTSSSREVEVRMILPAGPMTLSPNQLDAAVVKEVSSLAGIIEASTPPTPPLPDYVAIVKDGMRPVTGARMITLNPPNWPLDMATDDSQLHVPTRAELSSVAVAPSISQVNAKQVLPRRDPLADKTICYGSFTWAYADQLRAWTEKLRGTNVIAGVVVAGQEIERQQLAPNGAWSKPEIVKLDPLPQLDTSGKELPMPHMPAFDGANYLAIQKSVDELKRPEWQQQVLQPKYADIYWPSKRQWVDWRVNLAPTELNLAEGPAVEASGVPSGASAEMPAGTAMPIGGIHPLSPIKPITPPFDARMPMVYPNPTFAKQLEMGKVNAWFGDQTPQAGQVYRYRQRLKLVNPLLAMVNDVKDKADASESFIFTPWSDWSGDVVSPRLAEFFVTGGSDARGNVQVTIFSLCLGQVVEQSAQVTPGQAIGKPEKTEIYNPVAPGKIINQVDFSTGCVVVDMNFAKPIYGRSGLSKTIEMLYVDGNGQLRSRLQQLDAGSEIYADMLKQSRSK